MSRSCGAMGDGIEGDFISMTEQQFQKLNERFDAIEKRMITKSDLFQAMFTVHGFTIAVIVGALTLFF